MDDMTLPQIILRLEAIHETTSSIITHYNIQGAKTPHEHAHMRMAFGVASDARESARTASMALDYTYRLANHRADLDRLEICLTSLHQVLDVVVEVRPATQGLLFEEVSHGV